MHNEIMSAPKMKGEPSTICVACGYLLTKKERGDGKDWKPLSLVVPPANLPEETRDQVLGQPFGVTKEGVVFTL